MGRTSSNMRLATVAAVLLLLVFCSWSEAQLICDGTRRTLDTPIAPFPSESNFFFPIATPTDITCQRRDQPLDPTDVALAENQFCGGRQSFTCSEGGSTFGPIGPITHGTGGVSGSPEAVIPPSNPIIYKLTDSPAQAYLTFVRFTVVDVGTAGAKLGGVYGSDATKEPDVVAAHNWTANGDQGEPLRCGACSDCREGFGVVPMTVEAAAGAGFRAVQLSALFEDARCGGTCRDSDGMYWSGMEYSCVRPTCADADLDSPGQQPFDCIALGLMPIAGTEALPNPASDVCCQAGPTPPPSSPSPTPPPTESPSPNPPTAESPSPTPPPHESSPSPSPPPASSPSPSPTPPPSDFTCAASNTAGERYSCPDGFAYLEGSDAVPASDDNCCACVPTIVHPGLHFGKFGKFKGASCVKPQPPGPDPGPGKTITIGPFTISKTHTFQMFPFPFPFFGRR